MATGGRSSVPSDMQEMNNTEVADPLQSTDPHLLLSLSPSHTQTHLRGNLETTIYGGLQGQMSRGTMQNQKYINT